MRRGERGKENRREGEKGEADSKGDGEGGKECGKNGESQVGSPCSKDFAFTMLMNQQMHLGKGVPRRLALGRRAPRRLTPLA